MTEPEFRSGGRGRASANRAFGGPGCFSLVCCSWFSVFFVARSTLGAESSSAGERNSSELRSPPFWCRVFLCLVPSFCFDALLELGYCLEAAWPRTQGPTAACRNIIAHACLQALERALKQCGNQPKWPTWARHHPTATADRKTVSGAGAI